MCWWQWQQDTRWSSCQSPGRQASRRIREHRSSPTCLPHVPPLPAVGCVSLVCCAQLLVKWWSDYPAQLLEQRVVAPMQSYLTKELMATKKLTIGVMNAIKVGLGIRGCGGTELDRNLRLLQKQLGCVVWTECFAWMGA